MSDIWATLQSHVNKQIHDSGALKAVMNSMQFLSLTADEQGQTLKLGLSSSLSLGIAQSELSPIIQTQLQQIMNIENIQISFETSKKDQQLDLQDLQAVENINYEEEPTLRSPTLDFAPKWFLNLEYKLENFVNGPHSNFAYRCVEVFTSPQVLPMRQFFLYGPSGMGKTHLLHALGWQFKNQRPHLNVKLINADEFINDYHLYIAKKQMAEFRGKYRLKTDVLLIDDIQGLARAKGAQEELFNIFNYYEQNGKYIAFASDKSPEMLEGFEARLLTRFQGGLSAEIEVPDFATRLQILEFKQFKYGFVFSKEILGQIAAAISSSVRSLEGTLYKVGTYQRLKRTSVTMEELSRLIPVVAASESAKVTAETILVDCAHAAGLKVSDLKSVSRKREIIIARGSAMSRMRAELSLSYAEIGRIFGKDHSTVMNALRKLM